MRCTVHVNAILYSNKTAGVHWQLHRHKQTLCIMTFTYTVGWDGSQQHRHNSLCVGTHLVAPGMALLKAAHQQCFRTDKKKPGLSLDFEPGLFSCEQSRPHNFLFDYVRKTQDI